MRKIIFNPCILWLTGLSGSGKTSISLELQKLLINKKIKKIKVIDGDIFRKKIKNYLYNQKSRDIVGLKKLSLAKGFLKKGFLVIVTGIAANKIWRKKIKKKTPNFFEIYIKCPIYICKKRDFKNIYQSSKNYQKYQEGDSKDLVINSKNVKKKNAAKKIVHFLMNKKYL